MEEKEKLNLENIDLSKLSDNEKIKLGICPVCGNPLVYQEGCKQCLACGWSLCDG